MMFLLLLMLVNTSVAKKKLLDSSSANYGQVGHVRRLNGVKYGIIHAKGCSDWPGEWRTIFEPSECTLGAKYWEEILGESLIVVPEIVFAAHAPPGCAYQISLEDDEQLFLNQNKTATSACTDNMQCICIDSTVSPTPSSSLSMSILTPSSSSSILRATPAPGPKATIELSQDTPIVDIGGINKTKTNAHEHDNNLLEILLFIFVVSMLIIVVLIAITKTRARSRICGIDNPIDNLPLTVFIPVATIPITRRLSNPRIYDLFLSHKQNDVNPDFNIRMRDLARSMNEHFTGRELVCFLDKEFNGCTWNDIPDFVKRSKTVVIVLSENFIISPWCVLELISAVMHQRPIAFFQVSNSFRLADLQRQLTAIGIAFVDFGYAFVEELDRYNVQINYSDNHFRSAMDDIFQRFEENETNYPMLQSSVTRVQVGQRYRQLREARNERFPDIRPWPSWGT